MKNSKGAHPKRAIAANAAPAVPKYAGETNSIRAATKTFESPKSKAVEKTTQAAMVLVATPRIERPAGSSGFFAHETRGGFELPTREQFIASGHKRSEYIGYMRNLMSSLETEKETA